MKIQKKSQKKIIDQSNLNLTFETVRTPFFSSFNKEWTSAESNSAKHRVIREFWEALIPGEKIPENIQVEMLGLRLSYEFLAMDHIIAKVQLPMKIAMNLEASRQYKVELLHKNMKALTEIELSTIEKGGKEMVKAKKTNRVEVVHLYLEIFEKQAKDNLTDEQIACLIETKTGNKPTVKNVASYRCYYNQGKLAGQKSKPKVALRSVKNIVKKEEPKVNKK